MKQYFLCIVDFADAKTVPCVWRLMPQYFTANSHWLQTQTGSCQSVFCSNKCIQQPLIMPTRFPPTPHPPHSSTLLLTSVSVCKPPPSPPPPPHPPRLSIPLSSFYGTLVRPCCCVIDLHMVSGSMVEMDQFIISASLLFSCQLISAW